MTPREWRILEIAVVVVILAVIGIYSWSEIRLSHDLVAAAQAKSAEQESLRKADKAEADRIASNQQQQIEQLRNDFAKIKTPQQAAAAIPTYFPGVQPPTVINIPAQPATATTPAVPATTQYIMSADQMMVLAKQGEACQECSVNLLAAKGTSDLLSNELKGCTEEVKTWKVAAKGGSLWHRMIHDLSLTSTAILIGAVVGAVTVTVIKPWRNSRARHLRHMTPRLADSCLPDSSRVNTELCSQ